MNMQSGLGFYFSLLSFSDFSMPWLKKDLMGLRFLRIDVNVSDISITFELLVFGWVISLYCKYFPEIKSYAILSYFYVIRNLISMVGNYLLRNCRADQIL